MITLVATFAVANQDELITVEHSTNNPFVIRRLSKWLLRDPFAGNKLFDFSGFRMYAIRTIRIKYSGVLWFKRTKTILLADHV